MRARPVLVLAGIFLTLGCGDGVGRPIVEREPEVSGAGSSAGFGGDAGSGWGGYPGFGGRGRDWGGGGRVAVPEGEYCARVATWPADSESAELGLFQFLNVAREFGVPCTSGASGVAVSSLVMKPELQCAARLHALDMAERDFFDHVGSDGTGPEDRIRRTGYTFGVAGESIAQGEGSSDPFRAVEALLMSGESECENLVDPNFDSVGIGHFEDLWTLDFAGP